MTRTTVARDILTTDSLNRGDFAAFPFPSSVNPYTSSSEGADHVFSRLESAPYFSITEEWMPDGVDGTFQAIRAMCDAVMGRIFPDYSGFDDPWNIFLAEQITKNAHSPRAECEAILDWVKHEIRYEPHPITTQVVKDAQRCVESGVGDCVSMSVLIATLAATRGFPVRFCVQYWNDDELFTHIVPEVFVDGQWLVCDAVAKDKPIDTLQPLPDGGFNVSWNID